MKLFEKLNKQSVQLHDLIDISCKIIIVLFLAIIAYNTTYLKRTFEVMETANREKQIVVNVNNNGQPGPSAPSTNPQSDAPGPKPNASQTQSTSSPKQTAVASQSPTRTQPSVAEPNPNPTTHKVEMLNNSPEGAMVFSPPYLQIKAGDSVEFLPASYGHNVQTPEDIIGSNDAIPQGAKPFKGAMNEKLIVKFTQPGIYLYVCNYHYIVGHVGVIQVGNDSHNLDTVKQAGDVLKSKIFSHPDRVDKYLNMVKVN